jgi:uncharacterized protein YndB with AHSA1/START domain
VTADDRRENVLVVRRVIPVPRERVFAAWLDPVQLARFMRPGDVREATAVVDARVGGSFHIVMSHGRGDAEHWGEYLAIEPPSRLSFTWISGSTDLQPTTVTIEFLEHPRGTEVVLTHRGLPRRAFDAHEHGWATIVAKLDDALS